MTRDRCYTLGGAQPRGPVRVGEAGREGARQRVLGVDTSVTQPVLRLNYHPGHTRVVSAGFRRARNNDGSGLRPGRSFDIREAVALARLLFKLGTRDSVGAAAVDARGSVPVSARPGGAPRGRRRVPWAAGRRWVILLTVGWLVQAGLRVWFSRQQFMPLANPDETAYLVAARVLAGGPGADLSGSTLYQVGYPLLITPVYWFTSNPSTVYHAVLVINALISALVLPLGYIACRRLGLGRPAAYGVATVAALVPAGFFYSQYAMTDAVFPVVTLAWLLTTHSWLTASSARVRYAAAVASALLATFAYATHSRGLVMLAGLAAVGALIFWRQAAARLSVLAAASTAVVTAAAAWSLNHHISVAIYPEGTRSLSGQIRQRLASVNGTIHVLEMAAGQLWRLVLDSWGIAGIGLVAALLVIVRRDVRSDLRIMAALAVAVTTVIACTAPAALPPDQSQAWASGRYLDGMIIVFFLVGAVMLLRARMRDIVVCAAVATGLFLLAAATVTVYAGTTRAYRRVRVRVQLRRAGRADHELDPGQRAAGHGGDAGHARAVDRLGGFAAQMAGWRPVRGRGVRRMRGHGEPGGRGPDDQPRLADRERERAGVGHPDKCRPVAARRSDRRHLLAGLDAVGAAGVRGFLDRD